MSTLLLVRAPGLSAEQACRGDLAAHLSDLIADGSFARMSGPADLPTAVRDLGADRVRVVDLPFKDMPSFDVDLGRVLGWASGAQVAVLSDGVFISRHFFPEIKPGTTLSPADLPRLLSAMLGA